MLLGRRRCVGQALVYLLRKQRGFGCFCKVFVGLSRSKARTTFDYHLVNYGIAGEYCFLFRHRSLFVSWHNLHRQSASCCVLQHTYASGPRTHTHWYDMDSCRWLYMLHLAHTPSITIECPSVGASSCTCFFLLGEGVIVSLKRIRGQVTIWVLGGAKLIPPLLPLP